VAIVCVGNHPEGNATWGWVTSPSEGKEDVDRKSLSLPSDHESFVRRVVAANPNTVVVVISNFPFAFPWIIEHAKAVLHVTHASQELGMALGDVIFGDYNPGGKLAQTWPRSIEQLPPMLDYDIRHGRTYLYSREAPQYSFGYGLSYTTFELGGLTTSAEHLTLASELEVSVVVRNTGSRAGSEVVQLYVHHRAEGESDRRVERAERALKGFRRVHLAPGSAERVVIPLRGRDLAYWNVARGGWDLEAGSIDVLIGTSSREGDLRSKKTLRLSRA
jgi:beta-glucosidase